MLVRNVLTISSAALLLAVLGGGTAASADHTSPYSTVPLAHSASGAVRFVGHPRLYLVPPDAAYGTTANRYALIFRTNHQLPRAHSGSIRVTADLGGARFSVASSGRRPRACYIGGKLVRAVSGVTWPWIGRLKL